MNSYLIIIFCILGIILSLGGVVVFRIKQIISITFPRTPEIIQSNGYPVESHIVQSIDGYLLTMHRIPYGRSPAAGPQKDKPVVYLQHGLLTSSADWVTTGPDKGLAYLLADEGYDVWMGNSRGNTYSRNHTNLDPNTSEFWDFTFHEIALYDLPASIDYILSETGRKGLSYVGHSQGSTVLFIMLSMLPKYNDLIISAHAMAPAVFMSHMKNTIFRIVGDLFDGLGLITFFRWNSEVLPSIYPLQLVGHELCKDTSPFQEICSYYTYFTFGDDPVQLNKTILSSFMANTPAGCSRKQIIHFIELYRSGHFRQFDYGYVDNMMKYGSHTPPDYSLERITAPISLHYSDNDRLVAVEDVDILRSKISNLIGAFRIPFEKFNHADYIYAIDVKTLLYDSLISLLNKYNKG